MANSITVSDATMRARRDAEMSIDALKTHIKLAKNTLDCASAYDCFEKGFQRFVDRSVDGRVREFDRHGFRLLGRFRRSC
ncbi:uncharacterized protein N7529_003440 [Penicillium soppii]|uniref:uncharacterized protein n=1 Tax=Penicillium soppii TaxID=69789 RepID=UPI002548CEF6|nr:uncharacterized protein N7529_003440 [Penicillium soppii]KAJ5871087.1 hypothetical protein N7529_003440 [Penicillium soppii]